MDGNSIKNKNDKVAIIGCYPPPYGGVGIGVKRLAALLESQHIPCVVYNTIGEVSIPGKVICVAKHRGLWALWYLLTAREKFIVLRTANLLAYSLGVLLHVFRRKNTVIFFGNMQDWDPAFDSPKSFAGRLVRWIVKKAPLVVGVSPQICETVRQLGTAEDRIRHIPGFLYPRGDNCLESLHQPVAEFLRVRKPRLLAMVTDFSRHNNKLVYGTDILLKVIAKIREKHKDVGLTLIVPRKDEELERGFRGLEQEVEALGLSDCVFPYLMCGELFPLFSLTDIFLRPTRTDGDANSIREALYSGVPVLTSDAAPRPEGVVLYPTEDVGAFVQRLEDMIFNLAAYKENLSRLSFHDSKDKYLSLIRELGYEF